MPKPSPFYGNDKERQELQARRDAFTFSEVDHAPKLVVVIAGREGSGKTHLACTMSQTGPVYLIDTEYRAQIVTRKFRNVKFAVVKNFLELVVAIQHILKHQPPGTIVIDSGSDLQTFSEIEYLDRTKMEKVYPVFNWAEVWGMCNAIIDAVRMDQRFNLVITARVKEEYVGERATGQIIPRLYSALPYKADLVLQFSADRGKRLLVTKNGFTGEPTSLAAPLPPLPELIRNLASENSTAVAAGASQPVLPRRITAAQPKTIHAAA